MNAKTLSSLLVPVALAMPASAESLSDRIAAACSVKTNDVWYGGRRTVFDFNGYDAWVVEPPEGVKPADGTPWTWTMQWRDAFVPRTGVPQLLKAGYHHVAIDTFRHRMDEKGLEVSKAFQAFLVERLGFAKKANLIGMSWGGFFSVRYAASCPESVAKIYLDCPLLNLAGRCDGDFSERKIGPWSQLEVENWIDDPRMPVNMAKRIAEAKIPVLLVYGGADDVLDPKLNSEVFIPRFRAAGGKIDVVYRKMYGHHPHGFESDETQIADFFRDL